MLTPMKKSRDTVKQIYIPKKLETKQNRHFTIKNYDKIKGKTAVAWAHNNQINDNKHGGKSSQN